MTPLIDVTFQLIIFFMLVNNIIAEETVPMIVPELDQAKTRQVEEMERVVVNVAPADYSRDERMDEPLDWDGVPSEVRVGIQSFSLDDMRGVTEAIRDAVARGPKTPEGDSELEVLLRADAAIRYQEVQPVMAAISQANVGTIHLVAYLPGEGPNQRE